MFAEARRLPEYWEEGAILDFTEALYMAMEEQRVTRVELARRLGTSQAYITRVLSGHANFTLKTMAKLAQALGLQLEVGLGPQSQSGRPRRGLSGHGGDLSESSDTPQSEPAAQV
jgi:transcriptional regulator with XRE-family HTH domain